MKNLLRALFLLVLLCCPFISCEEDDGITNVILTELPLPSNLDATLEVLDGNRRALMVTPTADGVTSFNVFFGEVENETPVSIGIMSNATHVYQTPGTYIVEIQGVSPNDITNSIFFSVDIDF